MTPGFGDLYPARLHHFRFRRVFYEMRPRPRSQNRKLLDSLIVSSPFDDPAPAPVAEWTPPPAPDDARHGNHASARRCCSSRSAWDSGQSKGLATGSMICGILSCLCCLSLLTGPAAVVMGFIAKKATKPLLILGGRGLALVGMITGALGF